MAAPVAGAPPGNGHDSTRLVVSARSKGRLMGFGSRGPRVAASERLCKVQKPPSLRPHPALAHRRKPRRHAGLRGEQWRIGATHLDK